MKEVYQHTYQDGEKITLIICNIGGFIVCQCLPKIMNPKHADEYRQWRDEVVLPDLMDKLTTEEIMALAKYGMVKMEDEKDE